MSEIEIKVPEIGESINEVTLSAWFKKDGDYVALDEEIAEFESDKATLEFPSPEAGKLIIVAEEGSDLEIGAVICKIDTSVAAPAAAKVAPSAPPAPEVKTEVAEPAVEVPVKEESKVVAGSGELIDVLVPEIGESINEVTLVSWLKKDGELVAIDEEIAEFDSDKATLEFPSPVSGKLLHVAEEGLDLKVGDLIARVDTAYAAQVKTAAAAPISAATPTEAKAETTTPVASSESKAEVDATPVAAEMMAVNSISADQISGSGVGGRIKKTDVLSFLQGGNRISASDVSSVLSSIPVSREQRVEKMSRLRKTISKRLVSVKNETAMLTTFNDVNMGPIMALRTKYKAKFEEKHGVRLGFMSFFMKACANALENWPSVNAYIDEGTIIFNDFVDISIAVSTPKGLVVPVIRNCETLSMQGMESSVRQVAKKARDGKLTMAEMTGGTFTITNGGVFGSLLSTPIINAPQSAILGMHRIESRPVAIDGEVVIRSMMYLALSYDHRIIDGRESVGFLVDVKQQLENPEKLLFGADPVELLLGL